MPMAAIGPRLLLEFRSLSSRHRTPAITVPADAAIGSIVARQACPIAAYLSSVVISSSRKRETSSNA